MPIRVSKSTKCGGLVRKPSREVACGTLPYRGDAIQQVPVQHHASKKAGFPQLTRSDDCILQPGSGCLVSALRVVHVGIAPLGLKDNQEDATQRRLFIISKVHGGVSFGDAGDMAATFCEFLYMKMSLPA